MNIHERHVAELVEAQERFNANIAKTHEAYADDVQRSRDKLFAALNGEPHESPRVDMSALEKQLMEEENA